MKIVFEGTIPPSHPYDFNRLTSEKSNVNFLGRREHTNSKPLEERKSFIQEGW